jgi:hypothetical protein
MRSVRSRDRDDSSGTQSLQNNFLPPWQIKIRLSLVRENDYSVRRLALQRNFEPLQTEFITWAWSSNRFFKETTGPEI